MSTIDLNSLLAPIGAGDPCGADVEYNPAFAELDRIAQTKPEQQIGSTIIPASEPDWKVVQKQAADLLGLGKDLRVAAHLTKALLHTGGWPGFAQGLTVLRSFVENYWEGVYPRLDPGDDNDPTMRVNALMSLCDPPVLAAVRAIPLVSSRAVGRFSMKELEMASGEVPPPATGDPPSMASIEAAVQDVDLAVLEETAAAARACVAALAGVETSVAAQVDAASSPNYSKLTALIRKAANFLDAGLAQRGGGAPEAGDSPPAAGAPASAARPSGGSLKGEIGSREDVIKALDKICAYYTKYEPSSPVPLFMERCKRLVMMSFIDIVRDLVPDAVSQVEVLRGRVAE
jgi:type VI secretion system protein ImpA